MLFKKSIPGVVTSELISKNNILNDVLEIRRRGDYVPDYNKPKLYQEYSLKDKNGVEISKNIILSQDRSDDYKGDIDKWLRGIHTSHKEDSDNRLIRIKEEESRSYLFKEINSNYIMGKMMKAY